jgi:hypothetical protein
MRHKSQLVIVIWLLVATYSSVAADSVTNAAPKVALANLLSHMKDYAGKRVEVTGYYRVGFEMSALYQSQEDAASFQDSKALWIHLFKIKRGQERNVKPADKKVVRIIGVFEYNRKQPDLGVGHLNRWPAEIVEVELLEEVK